MKTILVFGIDPGTDGNLDDPFNVLIFPTQFRTFVETDVVECYSDFSSNLRESAKAVVNQSPPLLSKGPLSGLCALPFPSLGAPFLE